MRLLTVPACLLVFILSCGNASARYGTISGDVIYDGEHAGTVVVNLYMLQVTSSGEARRLTKRQVYGSVSPFKTLTLEKPYSYTFDELPPGHYSVFAYLDIDHNDILGFDPPEPFGWYSSEQGGMYDPINLAKPDEAKADCRLRCPTPFPKQERSTQHGALRWVRGFPVLQLWGTAEERGFAHGYLAGKQIIDFFEFYIIEDSWQSPKRYEKIFVPFLETHFKYPPEYLRECDAVIKGMEASEIDMRLESLNRDFNRTDLLAINAYLEKRAAFPSEKSSCTQFAFWGARTEGGELKGGLIAARNMDGECDIRKVTVSHFLMFAVDPSEADRRRWVSAMWPGFVGTISGINEDGLYSMENAGGTCPGPVVGAITPCSWIQRCVLETEGKDTTPSRILEIMRSFACEGGGVTTPGSIILWAVPYEQQEAPAFIYEGDRFGGSIRRATDVRPVDPANIMASNHHKVYGYDPERPDYSCDKQISFSSLWRYEVGKNMLEAWSRGGTPLGVAEAKRLLQAVSHGTTEYSVIFKANENRILIAVDDLETDMWDAPYLSWTEFDFDELFEK